MAFNMEYLEKRPLIYLEKRDWGGEKLVTLGHLAFVKVQFKELQKPLQKTNASADTNFQSLEVPLSDRFYTSLILDRKV